MIKGRKRVELTMDSILEKVTPFDIYYHFMPSKDWKLNDVTLSPFKTEDHPSFIIGNKYGNITHIAFNNTALRGDCFAFVKQLHNLSTLDDVLSKIDDEMGLGIRGVKKDYEIVISSYKQPEITKRNTYIQIVTRKFTKEELSYWNQYHQDISDLRKNNIYSIKTLYFNKQKFPLKETELRFGYFYPKGGYWKIYCPTASKKRKWLGNVPLNTSWGEENLEKDRNGLVCKSLKDYMVCRKVFSHVCGVQNESLGAFSPEFVESIKSKSKEIFYGGDSDKPGKEASYAITSLLGFKHINPPDPLLQECCKDFADMGRYKGLSYIEKHFKTKGLFG